ncbi:MAG: peptidylprolyl isomerase [Pirellulales bacterium]|nr:peptidylprolyl isomerase [Pirellulales bacterium]
MFTHRFFAVVVLAIFVGSFVGNGTLAAEPARAEGARRKQAKQDHGDVVATVNGKQSFYKGDLERGVAAFLNGQKVDPSALPTVQATVLKQTIDNYLLNAFLTAQKNLVTQANLKDAISEIQTRLRSQNVTFDDFLSRQNLTRDQFMGRLVGQLMVINYAAANTTEAGLKKYFEENKQQFDGTLRRVSHVLLRPDGPADDAAYQALVNQAKSLRDQIQTGQIKFEDAAVKYSAGPSRQRGGDVGYVPQTGIMHPNFTKTAYDIKPDELSEPVTTPFGIHLIKVTEVKAGTKSFDEVKTEVQNEYTKQLIQQLTDDEANKAEIVYSGNFPYFKKGTREVVMPGEKPTP